MHCSFCGKRENQVERLIAGPGVCICSDCVQACSDLLRDDMEFDEATNYTNKMYSMKSLFDELADRYAKYGFKMPKLVFWNVCSRTNTIPLTENEMGVILVSGFSVNVLSMVMSGQTDPWLALKEKLDEDRYSCISDILKAIEA